jgi:hypothetical protein
MSADFSFVLASGTPYSPGSEVEFTTRMTALGYRPGRDVVPVALDQDRGVYDEIEESEADRQPPRSCGWAREYDGPHCTLYVLVAGGTKMTNGYIDVDGKAFDRLMADGQLAEVLSAVGALAQTIHAAGGFATFDQAFEPVAPDRILDVIQHVPSDLGEPAVMGLAAYRDGLEAELRARFGKDFEISMWTTGYLLLTHRDLA